MTAPDGPAPATGEPGSGAQGASAPPSGRDWRAITIYGLVVLIGLLVIALLLVRRGDDDRVLTDATSTTTQPPASTTTTAPTTTSTSTTSTIPPTTTTTAAPAPTTATTARPTTTTTTSTTAPPATIAPTRCHGRTGAEQPEPVAQVFHDAWQVGDRRCAEQVATDRAVRDLFAVSPSAGPWTPGGCADVEGEDARADCVYLYEGGSATFELRFGTVSGWEVLAVRFSAD